MGTKLKDDGFKITPEMFKEMGVDLENWPTLPEALKAKSEADILMHQCVGLFLSKPVQWVLQELKRRHKGESSEMFMRIDMFNYGYIMGIRAERARRKERAYNG